MLMITAPEPRKGRTDIARPRSEDRVVVDDDIGRECDIVDESLDMLWFAVSLIIVDQRDDAFIDGRGLVFHQIFEEGYEAKAQSGAAHRRFL